ncbi:low molecular weight phosphotyrosine protein phosphatase [Vibrio sp. JPW-9-11-11]|uniref:low molecular weight protein-tyrosine-phosphatase n=1 Tax=Vibrio sp. JPW-9-11-11 TaxID=1416532 RepID=UPI00159301C2|nr:low molecular weight protein-tyrosine-phosphatase [Vibrio sp. JPW-9-11-11]NVD07132.1 low molecular weight phosphotyrosine protein phosphatase [Vibrio sp. JPW-9-11-11]
MKTKVLVVCMGNICRSPTGEAVLRAKANQLGVDIEVDSAGTIGYHQGNPPDPRAKAAGENRGYSFKGIRARKVVSEDFDYFDLILAADSDNLSDLIAQCPTHLQHKVTLFLSYAEANCDEIPDPYYGGEHGFELVLDLVEQASENLLKSL